MPATKESGEAWDRARAMTEIANGRSLKDLRSKLGVVDYSLFEADILATRTAHETIEAARSSGMLGFGPALDALNDPELIELLLPSIRNDFELVDKYSHNHTTKLKLSLTVLSGLNDTYIDHEKVDRWGELTNGACEVHWYPGGHFFHHQHSEDIAKKINGSACNI